jgi:hypothetical protein
MSYPINYPTPQGANVQIFQGGITNTTLTRDWVKPQGASFVWFTLIGAGGGGGGGDYLTGIGGGGGSGAVTNFMCPAFLIPDVLQVVIGRGGAGGLNDGSTGNDGNPTQLRYQQKATTGYLLLEALAGSAGLGGLAGGAGGAGGAATTNNYFSAMGFLNSVAGQNGADGAAAIAASTTTFLGGGSGGAQNAVPLTATGNYGYVATPNSGIVVNGFFQIQPIIVGVGGPANYATGGTSLRAGTGGAGCGGGGGSIHAASGASGYGGRGGDGLVVIVTW